MNFLRCFALGLIGGLIQGTVSQAKKLTSEFQGNLVLSTASRTEAISARPTAVMRRIELRSSDYSVGPTTDVFKKRERRSRRQMGLSTSAWQWDHWCMMQPVFGNCTAGKSITKYYYSTQVDDCLPHVFRACKQRHNFNQFETFDDCTNHCKGTALMPPWIPPHGYQRCKVQPISGRCLGSIIMYYWDVNDRICKRFEYGGCAGNLNRFEAESHCLNNCKDRDFPEFSEWQATRVFSRTTPLSYDIPSKTGDFFYYVTLR